MTNINQNDDITNALYISIENFISLQHTFEINYYGIKLNKMFCDLEIQKYNEENKYNLLQKYYNYKNSCNKLLPLIKKPPYYVNLIKKLNNVDNELITIYINNQKNYVDIMANFYKILIIENKTNNILNIKQLAETIIIKCEQSIEYNKQNLAYIGANVISSHIYQYDKFEHIYNLYELSIIKILKNEFEKLLELNNYDDHINKIKIVHKHTIALYDKLTIILEIK
jgi:hypothetical protein